MLISYLYPKAHDYVLRQPKMKNLDSQSTEIKNNNNIKAQSLHLK